VNEEKWPEIIAQWKNFDAKSQALMIALLEHAPQIYMNLVFQVILNSLNAYEAELRDRSGLTAKNMLQRIRIIRDKIDSYRRLSRPPLEAETALTFLEIGMEMAVFESEFGCGDLSNAMRGLRTQMHASNAANERWKLDRDTASQALAEAEEKWRTGDPRLHNEMAEDLAKIYGLTKASLMPKLKTLCKSKGFNRIKGAQGTSQRQPHQ
jgi:hypothetical protein